ncbi:MAG: HAD family hydrolase [Ardenticatenaceae bacterium]|nr:HAD family hydrolase [Ardenticatenaceae bacterium]
MSPRIQLIALDLDGTLLCDDGSISARNVQAIQTAVSQNIHVILATGKTRASAHGVFTQLGHELPGVFTQGLVIQQADGTVCHETVLDRETAVRAITFAVQQQLPHLAYCGQRIVTPEDHAYSRLLYEKYHEPAPEIIGPFLEQIDDLHINKFLVSDETHNDATRSRLTDLMGEHATVTQAVPGYIEMLPPGTSKGKGVQLLLDDWGIPPTAVLAVGDGENDLDMVRLAGVGVAMGNAIPALKTIADYVTADNNHSGVAEAIERFALT